MHRDDQEEPSGPTAPDADLAALLASTVETLTGRGARDEAIANLVPARRRLLIKRAPTMVPVDRAWRLGVLLLDRQSRLYATGSVTRAVAPGRAAYQSLSAEARRADRAAAFQGQFPVGEVVNYDVTPLDLDPASLAAGQGPLSLVDDGSGPRILVQWNPTPGHAGRTPLDAYLADRVDLLPPADWHGGT